MIKKESSESVVPIGLDVSDMCNTQGIEQIVHWH
jgi:hypothetical protein